MLRGKQEREREAVMRKGRAITSVVVAEERERETGTESVASE